MEIYKLFNISLPLIQSPMADAAIQSLKQLAESRDSVDFTSLWSGINN
jgi:hypothetical protein